MSAARTRRPSTIMLGGYRMLHAAKPNVARGNAKILSSREPAPRPNIKVLAAHWRRRQNLTMWPRNQYLCAPDLILIVWIPHPRGSKISVLNSISSLLYFWKAFKAFLFLVLTGSECFLVWFLFVCFVLVLGFVGRLWSYVTPE